jgi:hypothetical protein
MVDRAATTAVLEAEAEQAAAASDGHRAWVVRDALPKVDPAAAGRIRARLAGVRRMAGAASTSRASEAAERFGAGLLGRPMPEPPLN